MRIMGKQVYLDRQVGLVGELPGEVVRAQLEGRDERVLDEVLSPLVQEALLEETCVR